MARRKRNIPVLKADSLLVTIPMTVETSESGEYWLTPDQVQELTAIRSVAQTYVEYAQRADIRLPRSRKFIRRSEDTGTAALPSFTFSTVMALAGLTHKGPVIA